jgi:hypothetical protein
LTLLEAASTLHRRQGTALLVIDSLAGFEMDVGSLFLERLQKRLDAMYIDKLDGRVDATFCEDFDEPDGNYMSNWTSLDLGSGNTVTWSLSIPNLPGLLGMKLYQQLLVLDPSLNSLGAAASSSR